MRACIISFMKKALHNKKHFLVTKLYFRLKKLYLVEKNYLQLRLKKRNVTGKKCIYEQIPHV